MVVSFIEVPAGNLMPTDRKDTPNSPPTSLPGALGDSRSVQHGRNSLVWDAIEPLRPLIDARVFKFIAQREFVRSDFPQAGRNAQRIDRAIIAELLRDAILQWGRIEGAARWMAETILTAVR